MLKKSRPAPAQKSHEEPQAPRPDPAAALRASHRPVVEACARAAVRLALAVRQVFQARAKSGVVLGLLSKNIVKTSEEISQGKFTPGSDQLDLTEKMLEHCLADTQAAHTVVQLFVGQVKALDESHKRMVSECKTSGCFGAAVNVLREVSKLMLEDPSEEVRGAWRFVLLSWSQFDPMAPKIALWQPGQDGTGGGFSSSEDLEKRLRFDEESQTWTIDVKASFASSQVQTGSTEYFNAS